MLVSDPIIDEQELDERGFTVLPALITADALAEFEHVIVELCEAEIRRRDIRRQHTDPFVDMMLADDEYRRYLFPLLRRFHIVARISAEVGIRLTQSGFLTRKGFRAPLIWPYFRADLPHESTYALSFHQDLVSTESARAWRIWLPMRDVDRHYGSMELIPGSHKRGWLDHRQEETHQIEIDEALIPNDKRVCIEVAAGDAVLFHPCIVHRSVPNLSNRVKFVILVQIQDGAELLGPQKDLGKPGTSTEPTKL